jgi:hypothetical protein
MSISALGSSATRVAGAVLLAGVLLIGGATAPHSAPSDVETQPTAAPAAPEPPRPGGASQVERIAAVPGSAAKRLDLRVLSNGCPYSTRGIPRCGVLLGAAYGSNTDPTSWEESMGHPLGVHRTYWAGDEVGEAVATARADLAHQRVPWISFKLPHSWAEMATGSGDAWARDLALQLSKLPGPVWVAFHHEPEGAGGDIREWTAMQERLAPIVRGTAPNVAYSIILTGWNQFYGPREYSLKALWPHTDIDLVGFDVYNRLGAPDGDGHTIAERTRFKARYFPRFQQFAEQHHVAWGLAETGNTDVSARTEPWFVQHVYNSVRKHGGVAVTYFNSTLNSTAPWRLVGGKEQRFADELRTTPTL